jgi:hypothetical protein
MLRVVKFLSLAPGYSAEIRFFRSHTRYRSFNRISLIPSAPSCPKSLPSQTIRFAESRGWTRSLSGAAIFVAAQYNPGVA